MTQTATLQPKQLPREDHSVPTLESFDITKPQQAMQAANLLKKFVTEQQLVKQIKDRSYAYVEAWQFLGMLFGFYAVCVKVTNESSYADKIYKWSDSRNNPHEIRTQHYKYRGYVEIRRYSDDHLEQHGEMTCTNDEKTKHDWEEYAVLSMAQTRAQGKAWRARIGWIMKAAGFEPTPFEEMDNAKKEFFDNCPSPEEKRMLINLAYSSTLDEARRIEALATIAGCVDYTLFARVEARLRDLQPSIHEVQNPSQTQINEHLKKFIAPDVED